MPKGNREPKTVKSGEILDYYDGPLVFEATDEAGNHYIASAIPSRDELDRYAVTAARPERLRELREGRLGLRTLMLEAPDSAWYLTSTNSDPGEYLTLERQEGNIEDADALPLPGYTMEPYRENDAVA